MVAEGSGGHLIPALEVAGSLAKAGARVQLWYAARRQTGGLSSILTRETPGAAVEVSPIPLETSPGLRARLAQCGELWRRAQRCFDAFSPDVVVGFGGWISAPVMMAARLQRRTRRRGCRMRCVVHEQNVVMGRANRWLAPWVDRIALSFPDTQPRRGRPPVVVTGLPVRAAIGGSTRAEAAARFGFDPTRPTLLVAGGSQGSRAVNRVMIAASARLTPEERARWQLVHLAGVADEPAVREAYAAAGLSAWVAPFLAEMGAAYAAADCVIARAGASTIAELARCGIPSVLIPYPFAGGHQRANARLVERVGGGVMIEESPGTPDRVLSAVRRILADERLRRAMGEQVRTLHHADATQRLADAITEVAEAR